jgi:hypothetical protein
VNRLWSLAALISGSPPQERADFKAVTCTASGNEHMRKSAVSDELRVPLPRGLGPATLGAPEDSALLVPVHKVTIPEPTRWPRRDASLQAPEDALPC